MKELRSIHTQAAVWALCSHSCSICSFLAVEATCWSNMWLVLGIPTLVTGNHTSARVLSLTTQVWKYSNWLKSKTRAGKNSENWHPLPKEPWRMNILIKQEVFNLHSNKSKCFLAYYHETDIDLLELNFQRKSEIFSFKHNIICSNFTHILDTHWPNMDPEIGIFSGTLYQKVLFFDSYKFVVFKQPKFMGYY